VRGDGLDPAVCRHHIAELTKKKADIEREAQTLLTEDYYTLALDKNLSLLAAFRAKLGDGFERLPFGVQRQIVLAFVEGVSVRDRREVVIKLKVGLDNAGIQHLNDELDAVEKGTWAADSVDLAAVSDSALCRIRQSDPRWHPRDDLNVRPTD
jgi:hypothetical protein